MKNTQANSKNGNNLKCKQSKHNKLKGPNVPVEKIIIPPVTDELCKISVNIQSNVDFEGIYTITIADENKKTLFKQTTNSNCTSFFELPYDKKYHVVVSAPCGMSPSAQHSWIFLSVERKCGLNYIFTHN